MASTLASRLRMFSISDQPVRAATATSRPSRSVTSRVTMRRNDLLRGAARRGSRQEMIDEGAPFAQSRRAAADGEPARPHLAMVVGVESAACVPAAAPLVRELGLLAVLPVARDSGADLPRLLE